MYVKNRPYRADQSQDTCTTVDRADCAAPTGQHELLYTVDSNATAVDRENIRLEILPSSKWNRCSVRDAQS